MPELPKDLLPGRHYCSECKRNTDWYGERVQHCDSCGTSFPCPYVHCDHHDCEASRAVWGTGDWTDIFCGLK